MALRSLARGALEPATHARYDAAEAKLLRFLRAAAVRALESSLLTPESTNTLQALARATTTTPELLRSFLASEVATATFILFSAAHQYVYSTLAGDFFAFRTRALSLGCTLPPHLSPFLQAVMKGYRKEYPAGAGRRTPIHAHDLERFLNQLRVMEQRPATTRGAFSQERYAGTLWTAVLCTAFTGCLRAAEYTQHHLLWQDVQLCPRCAELLRDTHSSVDSTARKARLLQGLAPGPQTSPDSEAHKQTAHISLRLRATKSSPRAPVNVFLWATGTEACPVLAVLNYICLRRELRAALPFTELSPFFVTGASQPLTRVKVATTLTTLAKATGWSTQRLASLGPHSLRGGGATAAALGGAPEEAVKALGRWALQAFRLYVHADK